MNIRSLAVVFAALAGPSLAAQQFTVVPPENDPLSTRWVLGLAGVGVAKTQQLLFDAPRVADLAGQTLRAIRVRRSFAQGTALAGGQASIVVRLGSATRSAASASSDLDQNVTSPTEVFRGIVDVPTSPPPSGPIAAATKSRGCVRLRRRDRRPRRGRRPRTPPADPG